MVIDGGSNEGRSIASIMFHIVFVFFKLLLLLSGLNIALIDPGDHLTFCRIVDTFVAGFLHPNHEIPTSSCFQLHMHIYP